MVVHIKPPPQVKPQIVLALDSLGKHFKGILRGTSGLINGNVS